MQHRSKQKYGQNFLNDPNLLKKIVTKASLKGKYVLEVGPGKGALTRFIIKEAKHVLAYEIDDTLKPFLNFDETNINVIYDDFLRRDLFKDFLLYFPPNVPVSLIGNLPYYITSPILFKIIQNPQIIEATIMMQKEVALRLVAIPNNKNYNALSVIIQFLFRVQKNQAVKRHMFFPQPKVDSVILKLERKQDHPSFLSPVLKQNFITFVKAAFKQKRKILLNNLSNQFSIPKETIILFFHQQQLSSQIRAEQITLEEFQKISIQWFLFLKTLSNTL
ncbi:16S rRNA (adenine(1518)-N(6)/adenine(1519)-N(6))-dimethyltransferase RsmA [Candidatus Phytoplasma solani]|uniref:16S rRNA (adenine(1518)-N(6)/adenine(1519)-N(6))- dimethyltransferase RsmA n=1 Tax=Candidatus Phytoplasma solani TaxID=69896 RepID=UPI0003B7BDBB|nr:16S rRNA (adenine(1518)-N(6)/adenine(1519)-N(6))-dimethyltransferase RsmA [Candidatus Phytoplasma solani]CCP88220.1 dimethyladenosine transferase [Candidatus Phytoplasma solani]